jgi:hypothetical protein
MKKTILIFTLLALGLNSLIHAQSFNIGFLFNPGFTMGTDFVSNAAVSDSVDFQFIKYKTQFVLPLRTKFGVKGLKFKDFSFKKLDAKASQIFLNSKFSVVQPTFSQGDIYENIYNGTIGITALTASAKNGIWLYSANVFFSENSTSITKSLTPNVLGYFAKVKVKSLKLNYFYGLSLLVNQGKFYPVPIFGITHKFASKLKGSLIFPVQAKVNYKISKKMNIDIATTFDGINAIYREGSTLQSNDNSINYRQTKSYVGINSKLGNQINIFFEGGYTYLKKMNANNSDYSQNISPSFYASFSVNYHFGKSVFDNFINKVD